MKKVVQINGATSLTPWSSVMNEKPDDKKTVTITVNGQNKEVAVRSELTFADIVKLAFNEDLSNPNIEYTITYSKGPLGQDERVLTKGDSVKAVDGLIFDVDRTDN